MAESQPTPGQLLAKYLVERGMSGAGLGARIGVSGSLVSRMKHGERSIQPREAFAIVDALDFSEEDRGLFFATLGLDEFLFDVYSHEIEWEWESILKRNFDQLPGIDQLAHKPPYLFEWAIGRLYIARFDSRRAAPQMEKVERQAKADAPTDLLGMIYLDVSDAYSNAGLVDKAAAYAERCFDVYRRRYRDEAPRPPRETRIGIGRALMQLQEVAYNRGDEAACWRLHGEAKKYLENAEDYFGLAKSAHFLSLFRFWQGRLQEAEPHAEQARQLARAIRLEPDTLWAANDAGFVLNSHWWGVITDSTLLDVLACAGQSRSATFGALLAQQQMTLGNHSWMRHMPPFVPRYGWLADVAPGARSDAERNARRWVAETEKLGCRNLHTDLLIGYGDLLRYGLQGQAAETKARECYLAAARAARELGYRLLGDVAETRLANPNQAFPGLLRAGG